MRKRLMGLEVVVLILGLVSSLRVGEIINKQNQSADYIRTLNRNAATDSADVIAFNPAHDGYAEWFLCQSRCHLSRQRLQ